MVGDKAEIKTPNGVLAVTITQVKNESNGNGEDELTVHLSQRGLVRLTEEYWLNAPEDESVSSHISKYELLLERIAECTVNPVITILDTSKSVRYYRGRWSDSKSLNGSYIGRRPQLYGNDIWCFSKIENGIVKKFLDLPRESSIGLRGCDEAWRLQAALDAQSGNPQQYRLSKITDKKYSIELFSPIPSWVERRWNWLGERREAKGCLMSFQFTDLEIEQELEFLRRQLWCVACT